MLIKLVTDFERSLSKTQSMVAAAQELDLKVQTVENVDARGQDASGKQVVIGPGRRRARAGRLRHARGQRERAARDAARASISSSTPTASRRPRIPALSEVEAKVDRGLAGRGAPQAAPTPRSRRRSTRPTPAATSAPIAKELGLELRTTKAGDALRRRHRQLPDPAGDAAAVQAAGRQGRRRCAAPKATSSCGPKEIQPADLAKEKDALDRFGKQLDGMIGQRPDRCSSWPRCAPSTACRSTRQAFAAAFQPQQQQQ